MILAACCAVLLTSLSACAPRDDQAARDQAVLEWVAAEPLATIGMSTPNAEAEIKKLESFDSDAWIKQGQQLREAEETIDRMLEYHDRRLDRCKAVKALYLVGTSKSVPLLIEYLRDGDEAIRIDAAWDLGQIGIANDEVYESLVRRLDEEHCSNASASALAELFGKGAICVLRRHLEDLDWDAKQVARIIEDLEAGRQVAADRPQSGLPACELRRDQAVLEWIEAMPPTVAAIGTPPPEHGEVDSANLKTWDREVRALPDVEETIGRMLKYHNRRLDRRRALSALYYVGTSKSLLALITCLNDEDYWIRDEAITVLEHLHIADNDVYRALSLCLDKNRGRTRVGAAWALARIFGKDAIETLKLSQKDIDWGVDAITKILANLEKGGKISALCLTGDSGEG